jgi:hypothetical protein
VRAVNEEIRRSFIQWVTDNITDPTKLEAAKAMADKRYMMIAAKFYRPADINAQLARAIAEYLKAPGIGFDNIMSILDVIEARAYGSTN